ncbi:MAG: arginine--tRNA ligase [Clostridia bacterium]|nr:arginine--tRNA ligase [Clostridia bacterium]
MTIEQLKSQICAHLADKTAAVFTGAQLPPKQELEKTLLSALEYPPDPSMGDIAVPCFRLSKTLRMGPPQIAAKLGEGLSDELQYISKADIAGGYLNLTIAPEFYGSALLPEILSKGERWGGSDDGDGKTAVIDYSSPNVCKPFHIGHLGTTVIGHSLKLLLQFTGWKVIGINYLGDWGTQFGKMIVAYNKWGDREMVENGGVDSLVSLYVMFHNEAAIHPELEDEARAEFHKLEQGDERNHELWKWFLDISIAVYKKTYRLLDIDFVSWLGESFYTDKMQAQVEKLREKGLLKIDNGASIVDLSEYKMPPCLILKSDGSTLYPTRDIAAAVYRQQTYHFDKALYVTSAGQSLHFAQWFKVVELMGYDWYDKLTHVPYGTISVNGSKLATRTGNVVLLRDLFAEAIERVDAIIEEKNPDIENREAAAEAVGVGAVIFHYLWNSRIKDSNFVMEDALSFDGATGPYVQYTYARTASILAKAGEDAEKEYQPSGYIPNEHEIDLAHQLGLFPERVKAAIDGLEPSVIAHYSYDLATAFNRFYQSTRILSAESEDAKAFRLALTKAAGTALRSALRLICLKTPEKI